MILILQEIVHPEPEIFETEFAKVFATDCEWIEIIFFQISSELATSLLVFSPDKTRHQKQQGDNDGSDNVNTELALQRLNHRTNISFAAVATGLRSVSARKNCVLAKRLTEPWLQCILPETCAMPQIFPARLESVMFSSATSAGRDSAKTTALAISSGEIILSRGQLPSI